MKTIDIMTLLDCVCGMDNALIIGHSHPDGDCVGSAAALAGLFCALGKDACVLFPEKAPLRLEFLLAGTTVLETLPADLSPYTIICVDVASPTQLGDLKDALCDKVILRIDHHDIGTKYAVREFVEATAAATGEIIFDLCEAAKEKGLVEQIPESALCAVYGAISSDTGCFKYSNVTPETHLRAAKLVASGIPFARINLLLFDTKDPEQIRAEGIVQRKLRLFENGRISGVAIDLCDYADGLTMSDFETAVDIARSPRGVLAAAVVKAAPAKGVFRVSLRGNNNTHVADVAAIFGGGGHFCAAGCSVNAESADAALEKVVAELKKKLADTE